jgi:hypothetical protein
MHGNVPSTYTKILLPIQRSQQYLLSLTMGKAHMWATFSKCEVLNYHLVLSPLFWECPQFGALF